MPWEQGDLANPRGLMTTVLPCTPPGLPSHNPTRGPDAAALPLLRGRGSVLGACGPSTPCAPSVGAPQAGRTQTRMGPASPQRGRGRPCSRALSAQPGLPFRVWAPPSPRRPAPEQPPHTAAALGQGPSARGGGWSSCSRPVRGDASWAAGLAKTQGSPPSRLWYHPWRAPPGQLQD